MMQPFRVDPAPEEDHVRISEIAVREPVEAITGLRDFRGRLLRLLRLLGEFIARGGPLS